MESYTRTPGRPTLFVIPGTGGDNPALAALRADWSAEVDCVLLDYADWPLLARPGFSMEDLVSDLARRLQQAAPAGPVLLAGYSLGGFAAWAVADRLARTAHPVGALFILDADLIQQLPTIQHASLIRRLHRLAAGIADTVGTGDAERLSKLVGEFIGYRLVNRQALLRALARFRGIRLPKGPRRYLHFSLASELQARIVRAWLDGPGIAGLPLQQTRVIVVRAAESNMFVSAAVLESKLPCQSLHIEDVAGDHHSFLRLRDAQSLYCRLPALLSRFGAAPAATAPASETRTTRLDRLQVPQER